MTWFASVATLAFAQDGGNSSASSSPQAGDAAAHSAIQTGHLAFLAAMRANDANALVKLVAADVIFYPPNEPPVTGPEGVRVWFQAVVDKMKTTDITISNRKVTLAGTRLAQLRERIATCARVVPARQAGTAIALLQKNSRESFQ